jgi:secreted trypsin-like serine protease
MGGKTAKRSIPWQVSLRPDWDVFHHFCGGTILDSTTILTAAHCARAGGPMALEQSNFIVLAGSVKGSYPRQRRAVCRTIAHELYDSGITGGQFNKVSSDLDPYDIALMKLKEPLEFNENVYPACLPSIDTSDSNLDGKIGFASGWGQSYWDGPSKS